MGQIVFQNVIVQREEQLQVFAHQTHRLVHIPTAHGRNQRLVVGNLRHTGIYTAVFAHLNQMHQLVNGILLAVQQVVVRNFRDGQMKVQIAADAPEGIIP